MLGLDRKSVKLVAYRKEWKTLFEQEKKLLISVVGKSALAIEHVGSTSIAGIEAKPIIDIMIGVRDLAEAERCIAPLEKIGYEYRGEHGIKGRPFFRKGTPDVSTHHLSVVEFGGEIWKKHVAFRDFLRANKEAAQKYSELKKHLAAKFEDNREAYTNGKTAFVEEILDLAAQN